jgi:hypothetical protein
LILARADVGDDAQVSDLPLGRGDDRRRVSEVADLLLVGEHGVDDHRAL